MASLQNGYVAQTKRSVEAEPAGMGALVLPHESMISCLAAQDQSGAVFRTSRLVDG